MHSGTHHNRVNGSTSYSDAAFRGDNPPEVSEVGIDHFSSLKTSKKVYPSVIFLESGSSYRVASAARSIRRRMARGARERRPHWASHPHGPYVCSVSSVHPTRSMVTGLSVCERRHVNG